MARGWPVSLEHAGVGLRPLGRRDAHRWATLRADHLAWLGPWEATLPPGGDRPPADFASLIAGLRKSAKAGRAMPFAITFGGAMVGQLNVNSITGGSAQWASIGYWIAEDFAGRGITTTAVAMACDHLFGAVGLHRVEISIRPENVASLRVVEKLGFERVGFARRYLHIDGDWRDHVLFQLLVEDVDGLVVDRLRQPRNDSTTSP